MTAPAAPAPELRHVLHLEVTVGSPVEVGESPNGWRRVVPITGGVVTGPLFTGRVLLGGADVQLVHQDGHTELEATYLLQADNGDVVLVRNAALRITTPEDSDRLRAGLPVDPARVYFRCTPRFETAATSLGSLARHVHIGTGTRLPDRVMLDIFEVV